MSTLLINFHPSPATSNQGKQAIQLAAAKLNADVHNVADYLSLDNPKISAEKVAEVQQLILQYDRIIFVSPIYWLNISAIGSLWIEQVFINGFALKPRYEKPLIGGRKFMVLATTGAPSTMYEQEEYGDAEMLLIGYRNMCVACHLIWQGAFLISTNEDPATKIEMLACAAK